MTPRHLLAPARLAGSRLLATQSDERLVDLLRAGSEPAFEAIVSRYRGPLLRYCSALLGRERAEDAVQHTFVKAYEAMHRDDRPLLLKPWLYRIAHNTAHNALRDNALRDNALRDTLGDEGAAGERPEAVVARREQLRSVLASVQELPPRQRDALVLRELEGRSYEEISAALGVGGGAVRQLLNRARTTLRTAATAVTPIGLLLRLPTPGPGAGESLAARVAEMTGAAGAGAVVTKVAATALVTGAVAGGAAVAPLGESDGTPAPRAGAAQARGEEGGAPRPPATIAPRAVEPASSEVTAGRVSGGRGDSSGPGSGRDGGRDGGGRSDSSGPGGGSSGSGTSGSGTSGSGISNSGTSGSGTSGSGTSGSGTSGSGTSGSGTSGSGTSGTSGSGTSGSGTSGSGTPGSGSSRTGSTSSGSGSDSSASGPSTPDSSTSRSGSSGTDSSGSGPGYSASGSSGSEQP